MEKHQESLAQKRLRQSFEKKVDYTRIVLKCYGVAVLLIAFIALFSSYVNIISQGITAILGFGLLVCGVDSKRNPQSYFLAGMIMAGMLLIITLLNLAIIGIIITGVLLYQIYQGWEACKELALLEIDE